MPYLGLDPETIDGTETPRNSAYSGINEHNTGIPELSVGHALVDLEQDRLIEIRDFKQGNVTPIGGRYAGTSRGFDTDHMDIEYFVCYHETTLPPVNDHGEIALTHDELAPADLTERSPAQFSKHILMRDDCHRPLLVAERTQASYSEVIQTGETYSITGWLDTRRDTGDRLRPLDTLTDAYPGIDDPLTTISPDTRQLVFPDLSIELDWPAGVADDCHLRFTQNKTGSISATPVPADAPEDVHLHSPFRNKYGSLRTLITSPFEFKDIISAGKHAPPEAPDLDWELAHQTFIDTIADELGVEAYRATDDISTVLESDPYERTRIQGTVAHITEVRTVNARDGDTTVADIILTDPDADDNTAIRVSLWDAHTDRVTNTPGVEQIRVGDTVFVEGETKPPETATEDTEVTANTIERRDGAVTRGFSTLKQWVVDIHGDTDVVTTRTDYTHALTYVIDHFTQHAPITVSPDVLSHVTEFTSSWQSTGPLGDPDVTVTRSHIPDPSAAPTLSTPSDTRPETDTQSVSYPGESTQVTGQIISESGDQFSFNRLFLLLSEQHQSNTDTLRNNIPDSIPAHWGVETPADGVLYTFVNTRTGATIRILPKLPDEDATDNWGGEATIGSELKDRLDPNETRNAAYGILVDEPHNPAEHVASIPREELAVKTTLTHMNALTQTHTPAQPSSQAGDSDSTSEHTETEDAMTPFRADD